MLVDLEAGAVRDAVEQGGHVAIVKLDGRLTVAANQMMPMFSRGWRETFTAIFEMDPTNDAQFGENVERAINGGQAEVRIGALRLGVYLRGAEARVTLHDDVDDGAALAGEFVAAFAELGVQCLSIKIHRGIDRHPVLLIENGFQLG